jgi:hypothetical protein
MSTLTPTGTPEISTHSLRLLSPGGASIGMMVGAYQEVGCWESIILDLEIHTWIGRWVSYDVEDPSAPPK